jgi:hypothetical protein
MSMRRGCLYLVAIMDWFTRKVLAWRISNTLEADFCVEALNKAILRFGAPGIMNTDQGSQFTSFAWTDRLNRVGARISMDGKGRCLDNIFIERLWWSLKYACVYLHAWWEAGSQAKEGIGRWIAFYNHRRPHAAHGGQPPAVVYWNSIETDQRWEESSLTQPETYPTIGEYDFMKNASECGSANAKSCSLHWTPPSRRAPRRRPLGHVPASAPEARTPPVSGASSRGRNR